MPDSMFGTTGIRGDAKELFTDQFCFDIGRTFAKFLADSTQKGPISIARDPRDSSPRIKDAVASGLITEGFEVYDEGIAPIPAVNWVLKSDKNLAGSIMVSGSHIQAHLNGLKFFAFGEEISKDHERQIEEIYNSLKGQKAYANLADNLKPRQLAKESYIEYLLTRAVLPYPKWRAVIDPGNGAQSQTMPAVVSKCGLDTVAVNSSTTENFLARDTEVEEDFLSLKQEVVKQKADFGVGYDSDGDRAVFVDEKGSYIPGDYTGALIARETRTDSVVTPINSSTVIDKIGKKVIRTKVGSSQVVAAMKANGAAFGFEANGGGIFAEMLSRDGGRTTIEVLNLLAKSGKTLSELVAELPKYYIERSKVPYKWELKDKIIEEAKGNFHGVKVDELDGLKIWMDEDSWILFRSSANAPEFRVFAESKFEPVAKKLLSDGLALVEKVVKNDQS